MDVASIGSAIAGPLAWADPAVAVEEQAVGLSHREGESSITHTDNSLKAATVQTFARPHAPVIDPLRPTDTTLPAAANATSDFAIPADQLVPTTLVGLQVEPAWTWPLPFAHASLNPAGSDKSEACADDDARELPLDGEEQHDDDSGAHDAAEEEVPDHASGIVFDDPSDVTWCEPLTRALRAGLASRIPPQALLVAAEQWRRGRCVVLACPQGEDPVGPAWAFVLWPRSGPNASAQRATLNAAPHTAWARSADTRKLPLSLFGLRVEARLQWSNTPRGLQWSHVRVVKEHHPRRGRQLLAINASGATASANAAVACEVQLGPVLARSLRWCEVCVRINSVRRFWAALGGQWSVNVIVCSQPLAGSRASTIVEAT